jgi:hypothetical protein
MTDPREQTEERPPTAVEALAESLYVNYAHGREPWNELTEARLEYWRSVARPLVKLVLRASPPGEPPEPTHYFQIGTEWRIGGPYPCGREREPEGAAHCTNLLLLVNCLECLRQMVRAAVPQVEKEPCPENE